MRRGTGRLLGFTERVAGHHACRKIGPRAIGHFDPSETAPLKKQMK